MLALAIISPFIELFAIWGLPIANEFADVLVSFIIVSILFVSFLFLVRYYQEVKFYNNLISIVNLIILVVLLSEYIGYIKNNGVDSTWIDYEPKLGIYALIFSILMIIYQIIKIYLINRDWFKKVLKK